MAIFFTFLLAYCCFTLLLVSSVPQSESAIRVHIFPHVGFPSHLSRCRALSREFPVLYSRILLVIYFTHSLNSIYMSVPISQFLSWLLCKTVP